MNRPSLSLRTLFPLPCKDIGISHICVSICRHVRCHDTDVRLYTPRVSLGQGSETFIEPFLPHASCCIPYWMIRKWARKAIEQRFLARVRQGDIAYLWSDCSVDLFEELKARRITMVREKFNCHKAVAKRILDSAYERIGLKPAHLITDSSIAEERTQLALADFICCPSQMVACSMVEQGLDARKLITSSYGWSPERFSNTLMEPRRVSELTVLFVGNICVRKGAHLLLDAWVAAGLKGRLLLVGAVEPALRERYSPLLNRKDVVVTGFLSNPGPLFAEADIFAFPTLEEGDPLVSYEAAAHGLPMLVSPMGAGRGVRHGHEGLVLDPYEAEAWVQALRQLAGSKELRQQYGEAARRRSQEFTWKQVGLRLRDSLQPRSLAETNHNCDVPSAATLPRR